MAKILVVEDNDMLQEILYERLRLRGFEVILAEDGLEGLMLARREMPDVILMDISLPVVDGLEATRRLKHDPATAGISIIALTAHALAGDRTKSLAAGCDDYESKPINFHQLLEKIRRLLPVSPPEH